MQVEKTQTQPIYNIPSIRNYRIPSIIGVGGYSGIHDQPNGLEEDRSRRILPKEGICPI